jgi:hypothetical protein
MITDIFDDIFEDVKPSPIPPPDLENPIVCC